MGDREELAELRRLEELEAKVRKATIASNPSEYDPNSKGFQEKYGPGGGAGLSFFSGVQRALMGTGNLASKVHSGPLSMAGSYFRGLKGSSNESLKNEDIADQALKNSHPVSRVGGEIVGTLPLTMLTGGPGGASTGANVLTRTLASPYTKAALEGAVSSAALSNPDEQGAGAAKGAGLSMALQALFGVGGRAIKGLIKKSEEAQALEQLFSQQGEKVQPPISQVASDEDLASRLGKTFYQEALPLVPGVKGKLERQAQEALESTRRLALQEAAPGNYVVPADAGKKVGEAMHSLRGAMNGVTNDAIESLEATAHAARVKGGNFSMAELARNATDPTLQDMGVVGHAVLGQPATRTSLPGRILAGAGLGGFGAYMSLPGAVAALGTGNLMATKAFQRALLGDTQAQEALKLFMAQHPEMIFHITSALRTGAASQAKEE